MQRVIVTVSRRNEARGRDLEVPADVEAERLAEMIIRALRWDDDLTGQPVRYEIVAEPAGRVLHPYESLADADMWDGTRLVLRRFGDVAVPPPVSNPLPQGQGPVMRWRPLDIDLPPVSEPERKDGQVGFVWKQLD